MHNLFYIDTPFTKIFGSSKPLLVRTTNYHQIQNSDTFKNGVYPSQST